MIHDLDLLDRLAALPCETYDGAAYRATRQSLNPLASSYSGGRWMTAGAAAILYTSLERDGALAEIAFHWSLLEPRPTKPVAIHQLRISTTRTLRILRPDLVQWALDDAVYGEINPTRTQQIGAAIEFLSFDGLIAPSARWPCDHLMLFPDRMGFEANIELVETEFVDWQQWAETHIGSWSK